MHLFVPSGSGPARCSVELGVWWNGVKPVEVVQLLQNKKNNMKNKKQKKQQQKTKYTKTKPETTTTTSTTTTTTTTTTTFKIDIKHNWLMFLLTRPSTSSQKSINPINHSRLPLRLSHSTSFFSAWLRLWGDWGAAAWQGWSHWFHANLFTPPMPRGPPENCRPYYTRHYLGTMMVNKLLIRPYTSRGLALGGCP